MKKNKILILSHTRSYSNFKIGSHHYADQLVRNGMDVTYSGLPFTIFHRILGKKREGTKKIDSKVLDSEIKVLLPLKTKNLKVIDCINKIYFKLCGGAVYNKNEFDIVICDYPFFYPILSKIKHTTLVYRPTDDYFAMDGDKVLYYEKKICEKSELIISTSNKVSEVIKDRYNISPEKMFVIDNGFDSERFKITIPLESDERKGVVYVGALDNRFDFNALQHLALKNKGTEFDIYGPLNIENKKFIDEFKNIKNVNFKGAIEYSCVADILNKYKVGLLPLSNNPSNRGRSPMKLWEYLACGLTVLYSNIDSITASENIFKYNDTSDIVEKYNEAIYKGYRYAEINEKYSWFGKANEILDILKKNKTREHNESYK